MEKKEPVKVSLSTFFLVISIIVIGVMGYFLYISNIKTNDMISKEKELNEKISKLQNEITTNAQTQINSVKNNTESENTNSNQVINNLATNSLSGLYVGNAKVEPGTTPGDDTEVYLYLYEDGGFIYNNMPGLDSGLSGYYTYNGNELVLHEVISMANDIGRTIINETMTLKINEDGSIADNKLSAVLKKSSQKFEDQKGIMSTELKTALNNKSLR